MARPHYMLCLFMALLMVVSCKKTPEEITTKEGSINIQFTYHTGDTSKPWTDMAKMLTIPKTGDVVRFTAFRFYVSNIKLQRANNTWWIMPKSYFLLDAQQAFTSAINVPHVPTDSFIAISYTMGVDSAHNAGGSSVNALLPANGMYWDENRGYIMLRATGYSANSPDGTFSFDLGGYTGTNNIVTEKVFTFDKPTMIGNSNNPTLTLAANVASLWDNSPSVNVRKSISGATPEGKTMATDFYNGITVKSFK